MLETILIKDISKNIWDSMNQKVQDSNPTKRPQPQALYMDLEILGETINSYLSHTLSIAYIMKFYG